MADCAKYMLSSTTARRPASGARTLLRLAVGFVAGPVVVSLASGESRAQQPQEPLPAGAIVQKVSCTLDPGQSYALYLPSGYTERTSWPILYCFDPDAQGPVPVGAFKDGAEKYGYIVVGSNNSKNGPMAIANAAINAVWRDTHSRFDIDDHRVYAAGFSGGARVAFQFGLALAGKVAGVIACGAGFPTNVVPSRSTPFVVFTTIGIADFNYPELVGLARALDSVGVPNRLRVFDGPHQWAPGELCAEAIQWMQLQAMKASKLEKNDSFIDEVFARELARARGYESSVKPLEAYLGYEALARDFDGLKNVTDVQKKATDLRNSKEVKLALKQEKDQIDKQTAKERELESLKAAVMGRPASNSGDDSGSGTALARSVESSEDRAAALADLKKNIAALRKRVEDPTHDRIVWQRVLQGFLVECYETASAMQRSKNYALAAANLEIAAEIRPESRGIFFSLACAYSRLKRKGKAVAALKKAVENGYADLHSLETEPDLDAIRAEPEFRRILEGVASGKQRM